MFWIYGSSAIDNQSNIYVRITLNGKRVNLSLKQKIDIDSWYPKRQRVKGNSSDARQINAYLDNVKSELVQSYRDLKSEKTVLTPQLIKSRYLGEDKKEHTLKDIFKYHNELMLDKHSSKTQYHYRTTQKYLLTYFDSKLNLQNINLQKLNYELVIGFESFLSGFVPKHYRKKIQNNAVMKHIQRLKRMTSLAHDIEWIDFNPFVKFKLKLEKKERDFLTELELSSIIDLKVTIEKLQVVKDLFISSCYTGIYYSDIMSLTEEHIVLGIDSNNRIMFN